MAMLRRGRGRKKNTYRWLMCSGDGPAQTQYISIYIDVRFASDDGEFFAEVTESSLSAVELPQMKTSGKKTGSAGKLSLNSG